MFLFSVVASASINVDTLVISGAFLDFSITAFCCPLVYQSFEKLDVFKLEKLENLYNLLALNPSRAHIMSLQ